jgi:hypothetical protein
MGVPQPIGAQTLLLGATAAAVPVLLDAHGVGVDAEAGQLGAFPQTALEFGEAGESGQCDDVVPEGNGFVT